MLWQGEEFGENYFLPDFGAGRVALLRALRWDYFYDTPGQRLVQLIRKLLRIRRSRAQIRRRAYFFSTTGSAINPAACSCLRATTARHIHSPPATLAIPIRRCRSGFRSAATTSEDLHGGALNLSGIAPLQETQLTIPSHYGRIWSAVGP